MEKIRGMARSLPLTSTALVLGSLAIVGMPPFGLFISEFFILTGAFSTGNYQVAALILISVSVVFGALLYHFQGMLTGDSEIQPAQPRLLRSEYAVFGVCTASLLVLGIHVPVALTKLLHVAMGVLQ
jgi:hydrogenase-4 component F